jgi:hypothetical protein
MRVVPERINMTWIGSLTDDDLIAVEARLHERFSVLERREKRLHGQKYQLFRSPPDVMEAWDRWSRVHTATRARALNPRRSR